MAKAIKDGRMQFLITWPHCDVPKDVVLELMRDHWLFTYCVVAHEKHEDGASHIHCYVRFSEPHSIPRKKMGYVFDIVKRWTVSDSGNSSQIEYRWAKDFFDKSDLKKKMDYIPKPGADRQDEVLKSMFWRRWHPEIEAVKSPKDAIKYVKKHGDIISEGICPVTQCLTRKEKNKLLIEKNLRELVDDGDVGLMALPNLKRALDIYANECTRATFAPRHVYWYWGKTGVGKTKRSVEEACEKFSTNETELGRHLWISHSTSQWYDGYQGQRGVLLDDIRPSSWPFGELLRILDRYPIEVPVKGGFRKWVPEFIWITAPAEPRVLYRNYTTGEPYEGIEQLERRCEVIQEITGEEERDETEDDPERAPIDSFIQKEVRTQWDD